MSNLYAMLWCNSDEVAIESRVVQLAQGDAVGHDRLSAGLFVAHDVSCIQELFMAEVTESTLPSIRGEDLRSKAALVGSLHKRPCDVLAARFGQVIHHDGPVQGPVDPRLAQIIHCDPKAQAERIIGHHKNRPGGKVLTLLDPEEVNEGNSKLHEAPQSDVVAMFRVAPSVLVVQESFFRHVVLIRSGSHSRNRKRKVHQTWFEDALRTYQGNPAITVVETLCEELTGKDVALESGLFHQPSERGLAN